jgi:hypothetical protein
MLDGRCYFAEFPDESPGATGRLLLSPKLVTALAALEREISAFIPTEPEAANHGGSRRKSADT